MITTRLIAAGLVIVTILGLFGTAYHKGKQAGMKQVQIELDRQRIQWEKDKLTWEANVTTQTDLYESKVDELTNSWKSKEQLFREEIDRLKKTPDIVFVPRTTQCTVPKGFIEQHDRAAKGLQSGIPSTDFAEPTTKTLTEISNLVAKNYYKCNDIRNQLETLQTIVKEFKKGQKALSQ